jgi:hypothetical protein
MKRNPKEGFEHESKRKIPKTETKMKMNDRLGKMSHRRKKMGRNDGGLLEGLRLDF